METKIIRAWRAGRDDPGAATSRPAGRHIDGTAELHDRYGAQLYALALRIVRNEADAEDVIQEVFSQAWRRADSYDSTRGSVLGWLPC